MAWKVGQAKLLLPLGGWLSLPRLWTDSSPYFKGASSRWNVNELFFFSPCCSGAKQYCVWLLPWICCSLCLKKRQLFLIDRFWHGEPCKVLCGFQLELFRRWVIFVVLDASGRMLDFSCNLFIYDVCVVPLFKLEHFLRDERFGLEILAEAVTQMYFNSVRWMLVYHLLIISKGRLSCTRFNLQSHTVYLSPWGLWWKWSVM